MEGIRKILENLGLSSYKIEVYTTLLQLGTGTIQQIAKNSNIPACKIYENLKWLYERGYVSMVLQKPLTYKVNDPKVVLKSEIEKRKDNLNDIEKELEKTSFDVPLLETNIVQINNSQEAFYKKIKSSIGEAQKSISFIVLSWKLDSEAFKLFKEKVKKGVNVRALGPINKNTQEIINELRKIGVQVKNYDAKATRFSVIDKKTAIIRLRKKDESSYYSIWIKSEELAEILESYFDMLWK